MVQEGIKENNQLLVSEFFWTGYCGNQLVSLNIVHFF
jgi:hypothetical protein